LSQLFSHNVLKRRLVNTVTTSFNTITGQKFLSEKNGSVLQQLQELWPSNAILQHLTPSTETAQRSIESLPGSTTRRNKPWYSPLSRQL